MSMLNDINSSHSKKTIDQTSVYSEDLVSSLSSDFESYFLAHKNQGRDFYLALKQNNDLEGIQRKCDSLDSIGYRYYGDLINSMKRFDYLLSASDEELKKAYYGYFEPQRSDFYLGSLKTGLEYAAFRQGFYDANVNKPAQGLSPDLLNAVKIAEKMTEVQKRLAQSK